MQVEAAVAASRKGQSSLRRSLGEFCCAPDFSWQTRGGCCRVPEDCVREPGSSKWLHGCDHCALVAYLGQKCGWRDSLTSFESRWSLKSGKRLVY
mmetsp:Transcript_29242/g.51156  ORF Transcript_29242/g.51156 Transcript_29242/m.51156 type:complete len:95 (+) Transcript_29242:82-366(+)